MSKVTTLVIRIHSNDKSFIEALRTALDGGDVIDDVISETVGVVFEKPDDDFEVDGPFFSVEESGDGSK